MTVGGTAPVPVQKRDRMAWALVGRGFGRPGGRRPAAMVPALRVTLALAANLRNGSGIEGFGAATTSTRASP